MHFSIHLSIVLIVAAAHSWAAPVDFSRDIRPIFSEKCTLCHGPDDAKGGLRLTDLESAQVTLKSGKIAIVPGMANDSEIIARTHHTDPDTVMPPSGKAEPLTSGEKALLKQWINEGADWPRHWAYTPLYRPAPPTTNEASSIQNPIDAFVAARLDDEGIKSSPEADSITLIRRLYYDLIGLPPSTEQVDIYKEAMAENRNAGYARLVDNLLASAHFGERWGRHWLDIARFADSDGYEKDNGRPDAWKYRDWVINAINQDMPFDQFTIEQFAGDLLDSPTHEQHLATAFNRQTLTNTEGGTDQEQWRIAAVMDRVETVGAAWMGLTLTCARCHTHKFDEITHHEYYQLFAYFNNGDETTIPAEDSELKIRVLHERRKDRRQSHVLRRGEFKQPTDQVQPGTLASLPSVTHRSGSDGDRLDFARWLVSGENPLPPRVLVNHLWAHLFGEGLVATLNDFGVRGERPSHPQLLDWLAAELIDRGWSRKALIKTIVLSSTYRQSSNHRLDLSEIDAKNRLLARQNRFRVEAEIVRDLSLGVADVLTAKLGGPSVFPAMPAGVSDVNYNSAFKWKVSPGDDKYRRGLYTYFKRTAPHPNLITFDCPDSNVTCIKRTRSNTPLAALITLNNDTFTEAARALAKRVAKDGQPLESAFRHCLSRSPLKEEVQQLEGLLKTSTDYYRKNPKDAEKLSPKAPEQAPLTATVRILLNLDEFLTRN
ncbi:MAG: DUF1553 domain-containing protein [Verrucomicrobiaceae bacterium]|nr:DUF1553 domain-containing protein [Verrucomicrobiaceae bacterium]